MKYDEIIHWELTKLNGKFVKNKNVKKMNLNKLYEFIRKFNTFRIIKLQIFKLFNFDNE